MRLWFGPMMGSAFIVVTLLLAGFLPGYSLIRQTVSEIGGVGSPLRWAYSSFLLVEGMLAALFGSALFGISRSAHLSRWPVLLLWIEAGCYVGLAAYPTPHPLHNLFGLIQVVGYSAMLAGWLAWRRDVRLARLARLSGGLFLLFIVLFVGWIGLLIASLHNPPMLKLLAATQGLSQRAYIYTLPIWAFAVGLVFQTLPDERRALAAT
jgi:hypothetical membrane protein